MARVVETACTKSEGNKDAFMAAGIGGSFCQALHSPHAAPTAVASISRAVVKLTTADDDRPAASRHLLSSAIRPSASADSRKALSSAVECTVIACKRNDFIKGAGHASVGVVICSPSLQPLALAFAELLLAKLFKSDVLHCNVPLLESNLAALQGLPE